MPQSLIDLTGNINPKPLAGGTITLRFDAEGKKLIIWWLPDDTAENPQRTVKEITAGGGGGSPDTSQEAVDQCVRSRMPLNPSFVDEAAVYLQCWLEFGL